MLWSMGPWRVRHDLATEQQQQKEWKRLWRRICVCVCVAISLCYIPETSIVSQLQFLKKRTWRVQATWGSCELLEQRVGAELEECVWTGRAGRMIDKEFSNLHSHKTHVKHFTRGIKKEKKVKLLGCVWLSATPWMVAYQAPPSMGFCRQEYWSGLPFPSPGGLPSPGIVLNLGLLHCRQMLYHLSHQGSPLTRGIHAST